MSLSLPLSPSSVIRSAAPQSMGQSQEDHDPAAAAPAPWAGLTAQEVLELQSVREYPCVSVLMSTTPARKMAPAVTQRLRRLTAQAAQRLVTEASAGEHADVVARLEDLLIEAVHGPTSAAIALYASPGTARVLRLPLTVVDRVVIDPTFATRDLVRCLHRAPRHVVLVLAAGQARLFEEVAGTLAPARSSRFPFYADPRPQTGRRATSSRASTHEASIRAFQRDVDRALGAYLALHPAPLVLVGAERVLASFRAESKNLGRLAGTITGSHASAPLPELQARIRPVIDDYLHSRQREAIELLERRAGAGRVVTGVPSAWLAARHERPEMLAVEDSLFYPARLDPDGDLLTPATDVEHPDVIDDAVDELIELVLARGGWVALTDDGALAAHDRVALTLKDGPSRS